MYLIPIESLSRFLVVITATFVKGMNFFVVLDPLMKTFIQVALLNGLLSPVNVVFLLRKIEKDHPERISWK